MGGTLRGAWGSVLRNSMISCIVARVRLGGWFRGLCWCAGCSKMSASCWMASMAWASKRSKGAVGAGFARASDMRLAVSVSASAEDIAGMAPLWG